MASGYTALSTQCPLCLAPLGNITLNDHISKFCKLGPPVKNTVCPYCGKYFGVLDLPNHACNCTARLQLCTICNGKFVCLSKHVKKDHSNLPITPEIEALKATPKQKLQVKPIDLGNWQIICSHCSIPYKVCQLANHLSLIFKYECCFCQKLYFSDIPGISSHINYCGNISSIPESNSKCLKCKFVQTDTTKSIDTHYINTHCSYRPRCLFCSSEVSKKFTKHLKKCIKKRIDQVQIASKPNFQKNDHQHTKLKSKASINDIKCYCSLQLQYKDLYSHLLCHVNATFACIICRSNVNLEQMNSHNKKCISKLIKTAQNGNDKGEKLICLFCNSSLTKGKFRNHVKKTHVMKSSEVICPLCNITSSLNAIENHLLSCARARAYYSIYKEEPTFQHEIGATSNLQRRNNPVTYPNIKYPLPNSATHPKIKCPLCPSSISTRQFNSHLSSHTSDLYPCPICRVHLKSHSMLGHMASCVNNYFKSFYSDIQRFPCPSCRRVFHINNEVTFSHIVNHVKIKCILCESYYTLFKMKNHPKMCASQFTDIDFYEDYQHPSKNSNEISRFNSQENEILNDSDNYSFNSQQSHGYYNYDDDYYSYDYTSQHREYSLDPQYIDPTDAQSEKITSDKTYDYDYKNESLSNKIDSPTDQLIDFLSSFDINSDDKDTVLPKSVDNSPSSVIIDNPVNPELHENIHLPDSITPHKPDSSSLLVCPFCNLNESNLGYKPLIDHIPLCLNRPDNIQVVNLPDLIGMMIN